MIASVAQQRLENLFSGVSMACIVRGLAIALLALAPAANAAELTPEQRKLFDIYKELVEINTTDSRGAGDGDAADCSRFAG
jgi:hypothetical protein